MTVENETKTVETEPEKSEADKIWEEIKMLPIEMFALPNQLVQDHVFKKAGTATQVVLTLRSAAVLPSLEATLAAQKSYTTKVSRKMKAEGENVTEAHPKYDLEEAEGYVLVGRHVKPQERPELKPEYFISGQKK